MTDVNESLTRVSVTAVPFAIIRIRNFEYHMAKQQHKYICGGSGSILDDHQAGLISKVGDHE